jgi:hypothetical protein
VAAVVAVRVISCRDLPAFLTNDSWDYLAAARDIHRDANFFSVGLRDVRLPGYPTLLALVLPVTGWRPMRSSSCRTALGLATVAMGWGIGRVLGSPLVSWTMVAFLGLNPVYLLNEHTVMCESFGLTLYMLLVLVGLACLRRRTVGWLEWRDSDYCSDSPR